MSELKLRTFFEAANNILDIREKEAALAAARVLRERAVELEIAERNKRHDIELKELQKELVAQYLKPALESLKAKGTFDYQIKKGKRYIDKWYRTVPATMIALSHTKSGKKIEIALVNAGLSDYSIDTGLITHGTLQGTLEMMARTTLEWAPKEVEKLSRKHKAPVATPRSPGR